LKPKEISQNRAGRRQPFDLQHNPNYLKVKTSSRNPAGAKFGTTASVLP
jgi:hypothetical protein